MASDLCAGFVGYDPDLDGIVAGHQGTNPKEMYVRFTTLMYINYSFLHCRDSLLEDSDIIRSSFDTSLFPGLSSSITAHSGFLYSQSL